MRVRVSNQQSEVPLPVRLLQRQLKRALPLLPRTLPLSLTEIQFVLVDRETMARVHGRFLEDSSETDVITFPYGEILVCPAVARERSSDYQLTVETEVLLYCLHGLLHLAGYDDVTPTLARKMGRTQDKLLKELLKLR